MKMRWLLALAILGLALVVILVWRLDREVQSARRQKGESVTAVANSSAGTTTVPSSDSLSPGNPAVGAPSASAEDPEFQRWLSAEAQRMNQRGQDGESKRKELAKVAAELTPAKAQHLLQIAKNVSSPAGEKILAAYLLVEAGPLGLESLRSLITTPLSLSGPQEPHSEGELRATQERSVRMMAIDGLASQAEKNPSARETLVNTIPNISDPYIKSLAEKRLSQIKAQ